MLPVEVQNAEVIDWWEAERFFIHSECERQFARLAKMADETIDSLSKRDAIWVRSDARDDLKKRLRSEVEMHNRRMARHLNASYKASMSQIEAFSEIDGGGTTDFAVMAAGIAGGAGAIGLAVGAGAFVPVTATYLFVIPVASLASWPVAATLGTSAIAAAWLSPKLGTYAADKVRSRYKISVQRTLRKVLISEDDGKSPSAWKNFSTQLDALAQSRLAT